MSGSFCAAPLRMMTPARDLCVSLVQGETVWHDPDANRTMYAEMMAPLAGKSDLIILPETFTSGFSNEALISAEDMGGPSVAWIRAQATLLGAVVTGSVQIRDAGGVFNRLLWATPAGELHHYDKRHLFRMAREHDRYTAGHKRKIFELKGWRICPLVCYDLRFPVFIRNRFGKDMENRFDYDLLLFVANWPGVRRNAWRTLLRARAMENLCYVAGVNRVGNDGNGLGYAGDSAALDCLGEPLVECGLEPEVVSVIFLAAELTAHRQRFPAQLDADGFVLLD